MTRTKLQGQRRNGVIRKVRRLLALKPSIDVAHTRGAVHREVGRERRRVGRRHTALRLQTGCKRRR